MINAIGHLAFRVADMDRALAFYCDVLGFKKAFTLDKEGKPWIVYLKLSAGQFIELFYGGEGKGSQGSFLHLCLTVDDINDVVKRLSDCGYPIDRMPSQGKDKNYQCWAVDPDGNRIEFMQISPDSPQANS